MWGLLCGIERFCRCSFAFMLLSVLFILQAEPFTTIYSSVARLIKASKSNKSSNRDSYIAGFAAAASGSSTSLKSDFSLGVSSRALNNPSTSLAFNLNASTKLSLAQAELQACEVHLAARERELDEKRALVVGEGLSMRCRALVECGWVWGEMGREGVRTLEGVLGREIGGGEGESGKYEIVFFWYSDGC